jgi:hypothetical protein
MRGSEMVLLSGRVAPSRLSLTAGNVTLTNTPPCRNTIGPNITDLDGEGVIGKEQTGGGIGDTVKLRGGV